MMIEFFESIGSFGLSLKISSLCILLCEKGLKLLKDFLLKISHCSRTMRKDIASKRENLVLLLQTKSFNILPSLLHTTIYSK